MGHTWTIYVKDTRVQAKEKSPVKISEKGVTGISTVGHTLPEVC